MKKSALQTVIYGGLLELARDSSLFYNSIVGSDYSHLTEEGTQVFTEYLNKMLPMMLKNEKEELDQRAKDLVINGLKGDNN